MGTQPRKAGSGRSLTGRHISQRKKRGDQTHA